MYRKRRQKNKQPSFRGFVQLNRNVLEYVRSGELSMAGLGAYVTVLLTAYWTNDIHERTARGPSDLARYTGMNKSSWSRHLEWLNDMGLLEDEDGYVPYFFESENGESDTEMQQPSA